MTLFPFLFILMPWRTIKKLIANEYPLIGFVAYILLLVFEGYAKDACLFSAIMFGMCFFSMYPLFYQLLWITIQFANISEINDSHRSLVYYRRAYHFTNVWDSHGVVYSQYFILFYACDKNCTDFCQLLLVMLIFKRLLQKVSNLIPLFNSNIFY
jgi:hypothetical protein